MKWTTIAELLILVISAGLGIRQLVLLRTQMRDQHEEHRRENTMNIMTTWCNSLNKDPASLKR